MDETTLQSIAAQLRQPHGEYAAQVGEKMNEGNLHINLNTIEILHPQAGDNILEIGMGNGFFVKNVIGHSASIKYTGCDFSAEMVAAAEQINDEFINGGQVNFMLADANNLPFETNTFDKIFTINTAYFWDDADAVLMDIFRVLKPNGKLYISVRPKSVMEHYPFVKYGFTLFTKEALVQLLTRNNFRVTAVVEKQEPDIDLNGIPMSVESLIVCGEK